MARPFQGILTVAEFIGTGTPGEYVFYGAAFQSETDPTSSGAYAVAVGMVLYVQAMDRETADPLPGVAHRFVLTAVTPFSESLLDGIILWDEDGDEVDAPLNRSTGLLSEVTALRGFGQPAAPGIYEQIPPGMWEAALLADLRRIADHGGGGATGPSGPTGPTGPSGGGVGGDSKRWRLRRGL